MQIPGGGTVNFDGFPIPLADGTVLNCPLRNEADFAIVLSNTVFKKMTQFYKILTFIKLLFIIWEIIFLGKYLGNPTVQLTAVCSKDSMDNMGDNRMSLSLVPSFYALLNNLFSDIIRWFLCYIL